MPASLRDAPDGCVELIKSFEGIPDGDPSTANLDAYLDPLGIWTIGWGHAIRAPGGADWLRGAGNTAVARSLYPGGLTIAQAEALLRGDLVDTCRDVQRLVTGEVDDGQFGALVSFAFNVGAGNLAQSTLLKLVNSGDVAGAADQFLAWNKGRVNGVLQPLPGLTRRRRAERALFLGEDWRAASAARGAVAPHVDYVLDVTPEGAPLVDTAVVDQVVADVVVAKVVVADTVALAGAGAQRRKPARKAASARPPKAKAKPVVKTAAKKGVKKPQAAAKAPAKKAAQRAAAKKSGASAKPRARTTTATSLPPAPPAKRPRPRTAR